MSKKKKLLKDNSYLHSNMVRFIIKNSDLQTILPRAIYIPIWLDLLFY